MRGGFGQTGPAAALRRRRHLLAVCAGFLAGSLVVAGGFAGFLSIAAPPDVTVTGQWVLAVTGLAWLAVMVVGLPGFVVLRWGLGRVRRLNMVSHTLAGALNGIITWAIVDLAWGWGMDQTLALILLLLGAVGGIVTWRVERWTRAG